MMIDDDDDDDDDGDDDDNDDDDNDDEDNEDELYRKTTLTKPDTFTCAYLKCIERKLLHNQMC